MTCPPIWQLISNKKTGLADRMQRERAWELLPRFTKKPLNALGVKVLMPLPVLRFLCFCSALSRVWLCNPTDCSMLGFPVLHCLSKVTQIRVHCQWCHPTISSSIVLFSSCPQSSPALGSFPLSCLFASGHQSIGASASESAIPMNTKGLFPLGLTGFISLLISISWYFLRFWFPAF